MDNIIAENVIFWDALITILVARHDISTLRAVRSLSRFHYHRAKKKMAKKKFKCLCNCQAMKEYKIYDEVRRWNCANCRSSLDPFNGNCWNKTNFRQAKLQVCQTCFRRHWNGVGIRPLNLTCV